MSGYQKITHLLANVITVTYKYDEITVMNSRQQFDFGVELMGTLKWAFLCPLDSYQLFTTVQVASVHLAVSSLTNYVLITEIVSRTGQLFVREGSDSSHFQIWMSFRRYCHEMPK